MAAAGPVLVGTWSLAPTPAHGADKALVIGAPAEAIETAFSDDKRKVVSPRDILPSGKYGAIVKLQIKYERQSPDDDRWAQGTGWLIRDNLFVTAGHCAYDWSHSFGKASEIKVYSGYNGKESIGSPTVQFRHGVKIATTQGWLQSDVNRDNDVAFVQVDQPFKQITPIKFSATPLNGKLHIGVVGYPADKTLKDERGAQMYEEFAQTIFDLAGSEKNMLEYRISTYAGQSGSPVLIDGQNTSIGAHVYGLVKKNSASVIRGAYGNAFQAYIDSLTKKFPPHVQLAGVTYVQVPVSAAVHQESDVGEQQEGFFDVLKKVVSIGTSVGQTVLKVGTPFLGPSAAPIAAAAGQALAFANRLASSSHGAETALEVDHNYKGLAERSLLAEGALQTVLAMSPEQAHKHGILTKMQEVYDEQKDHIKPVASQVLPAILEPALRIALHTANEAHKSQTESSISAFPAVSLPPDDGKSLAHQEHQFLEGLTHAAAAQHGHGEEGFFDFLGKVAKTGISVIAPHMGTIAKVVGSVVGGTESDLDPSPSKPHLETLAQRAVLGEAALQALMQVPAEHMHAEGFFSSIINVVKRVGPIVVQSAPTIAAAVTPVVKALLAKSPESCLYEEPANSNPNQQHHHHHHDQLTDTTSTAYAYPYHAGAGLEAPPMTLRSKTSIADLVKSGDNLDKLQAGKLASTQTVVTSAAVHAY